MLDQARLGKQRVEAYQIVLAYEEATKRNPAKYSGWLNLPAVRMWDGYLPALYVYGILNCMVWRKAGHEDSLLEQFQLRRRIWLSTQNNGGDSASAQPRRPWWFGHPAMVRTHQTKLYHKNSAAWVEQHKTATAKHEPMKLPYLWPDPNDEGTFRISVAEQKRSADWEIPTAWSYDHKTRVIVPR